MEKEEAFEEAAKKKDRDSSVPSQQIGDGCSGEDTCRERECVADRKGKRGEQRPGRGRGQVVGCMKRKKKAEERVERQTTDTMARRRRRRKRLARSYCESAPVPLRLAAAAGAASGAWPRLLTLRRNNTTPTRGINARHVTATAKRRRERAGQGPRQSNPSIRACQNELPLDEPLRLSQLVNAPRDQLVPPPPDRPCSVETPPAQDAVQSCATGSESWSNSLSVRGLSHPPGCDVTLLCWMRVRGLVSKQSERRAQKLTPSRPAPKTQRRHLCPQCRRRLRDPP